ncbi:hypothetical protein [Alteromonas halophila]|uniref:VWA domain-containing protein n=1 Tax=Alteromonas halophila TaxID=516698 RepID=A0A918JIJ4_9ALTE|nr:hypothetical protein [Alteromonas halophila]GGW78999.1 hypothetical protein GCM10007391_09580 [Alteromonas halophila]
MIKRAALMMLAAAASHFAVAQADRDDIVSCYDYAEVADIKPTTPLRDIVVMVDQTVNLDTNLKKSVHHQVQQLVGTGDRIRVVSFSANAQGRYTDITFDGEFDQPMSEEQRNAMNRLKLGKFDKCMEMQSTKAINLVHKQLKGSFHDSDQNYPKTELVGSLLDVSKTVFAENNTQRRILILVSDMLENSDMSSFYSAGSVRAIDADAEFAKYANSIVPTALSSVEVFVIGGGYAQGGSAYSSQSALNSLEAFWEAVVKQAGGTLKQFGTPQLLTDIK